MNQIKTIEIFVYICIVLSASSLFQRRFHLFFIFKSRQPMAYTKTTKLVVSLHEHMKHLSQMICEI